MHSKKARKFIELKKSDSIYEIKDRPYKFHSRPCNNKRTHTNRLLKVSNQKKTTLMRMVMLNKKETPNISKLFSCSEATAHTIINVC